MDEGRTAADANMMSANRLVGTLQWTVDHKYDLPIITGQQTWTGTAVRLALKSFSTNNSQHRCNAVWRHLALTSLGTVQRELMRNLHELIISKQFWPCSNQVHTLAMLSMEAMAWLNMLRSWPWRRAEACKTFNEMTLMVMRKCV